jgi:arylsulfatase A-like enzyme
MFFWLHALRLAVADLGGPPEVIMITLIDDLGWADIQPYSKLSPTPHIGELAASGLMLENVHAYMYCSPSRRSLLTGRFPVHISGKQAPECSNFLPLPMTLLSKKMKQANFSTHFIGKGHLGYQTTDHLPTKRGFDTHVGYLEGDQNYEHGQQVMCDIPQLENLPVESWHGQWPPPNPPHPCHLDMWEGNTTASADFLGALVYSTDTYAAEAIKRITAKVPDQPLFIYLAWQAVHGPWVQPDGPPSRLLQPNDPGYSNYCSSNPLPVHPSDSGGLARTQHERCYFGSLLKVLDQGMANVTTALKSQGLWDSTLMFVMSDNGGVGPGSNYPLRGQKSTPWQGGTR